MTSRSGRIAGIARRDRRRAPMETIDGGRITIEAGLDGDHKGRKFKTRAITILAREAWELALAELSKAGGPAELDWTVRRANLLTEGIELPRARGARIGIGTVILEVTYPTQPCARMDEACPGLLKALQPGWRGGVTCRVIQGGDIAVGDRVETLFHPGNEVPMKLP